MPPAVVVVISVFWFCEDFWFCTLASYPSTLSNGDIWFGVVLPIELIKACKKHTKANSPKNPGFLSKNTSRTLQSFGLSLLILFRPWLRGVYETSSGSVEVSEAALEVARVAAQVATTTEMREPPPGEWHGDERFLRFEISSEETKGLLKICKHS